jgi:hypothetical protein
MIFIDMNVKYTKKMLEPLVKTSISVMDVMRKLGIKFSGGNHSHISKRIKYFEIDTMHFRGSKWNLGLPSIKKKPWNQVLILRNNGLRHKSYALRRALMEYGTEYKCEICNLLPTWENKELRLQIDHKNRNWLDDRPENLRFICPNCHSQTEGYAGSQKYSDLLDCNRYQREKRKNKAEKC